MLLLQTARAGRAAFTLLFLSSLVTVPPPEEPGLIFDESLILPAPSPPLPPTPIANETIPVHKEEPPRPDPPAWLLSLDIDPVVWFLWHNVVAAAVSRKLLGVISTALSPATKGSQDRVPATAQGDKCDQPVQIDDDMRLDKEDLMAELDVYRDAVAALVQAKKKLQGELDLHLAKPWAPIVAPLVNAQDVSRIKQDKVSSIVLVLDSIEATMRPKLVDRLETHLRNSACHRVLQAHIYYVNDVASKDHLFNALDPSGNHCRDRPMMTVVAYDARKSQPAIFVPSSLDRLLVKRTRLGTGKLVTSLNEAQIGVLVRLVLHAISAVHGWTPIKTRRQAQWYVSDRPKHSLHPKPMLPAILEEEEEEEEEDTVQEIQPLPNKLTICTTNLPPTLPSSSSSPSSPEEEFDDDAKTSLDVMRSMGLRM